MDDEERKKRKEEERGLLRSDVAALAEAPPGSKSKVASPESSLGARGGERTGEGGR